MRDNSGRIIHGEERKRMSRFSITHQISEQNREALLAGLGGYNRQFIQTENWGPLSVMHRDTQGTLRG